MLILRKGEQITCEGAGHHIATAKRDIETGDDAQVDDFDWVIPSPGPSDDIGPCPICGADYIRGNAWTGILPHTAEGWKQ